MCTTPITAAEDWPVHGIQGTEGIIHSKVLLICLAHHLICFENTNYMAAAPTANPQFFSSSRPNPVKSNASNMPLMPYAVSRAILKTPGTKAQEIPQILQLQL